MISSMTGYGRMEADCAGRRLTVEIRSVNNRYLEIQVKMPRTLAALEPGIRKALQERFSRGRFDVFITRNGDEGVPSRFTLDTELAGQYVALLRDLKARFDLPGEVDLPLVGGIPDIIRREETREDPETLWNAILETLSRSLSELQAMRTVEGAALARDMKERIAKIENLVAKISERSPLSVETAHRRMEEAVKRLSGEEIDPLRLAQEIAILAERTDITEELTRLASHMVQFARLIDDGRGEAVGRKLDFLLQEMGREANTIASKAMDTAIAHDVVEIKAELEKIREQAQNIE